jgi:hypothetical protein
MIVKFLQYRPLYINVWIIKIFLDLSSNILQDTINFTEGNTFQAS